MPWKNGSPLLYSVWRGMLSRCYNHHNRQYCDYGGRGIVVCPQWRHDYKQFYADMAPKPLGLSLDRINNNGDYTPENCRWATRKEQQRNQRRTHRLRFGGQEYLAVELAERTGMKVDTILARAKAGLSYAEVISLAKRFSEESVRKAAAISAVKRRNKQHCKRGHEFTPENTYIYTHKKGNKQRVCRACHAAKVRRQFAKKKALPIH